MDGYEDGWCGASDSPGAKDEFVLYLLYRLHSIETRAAASAAAFVFVKSPQTKWSRGHELTGKGHLSRTARGAYITKHRAVHRSPCTRGSEIPLIQQSCGISGIFPASDSSN